MAPLSLSVSAEVEGTLPSSSGRAFRQVAERDRFEDLRQAYYAEAKGRIQFMIEGCRKASMYRLADSLHAFVLACEPQNGKSRRALGFVRRSNKEWVRSKGFRPRRDHGDAEEEQKWRRLVDAEFTSFRARALEIIERERQEARVSVAWRTLVRLGETLPEDEIVRGLLGETLVDGEWLLTESVRAKHRRAAYPSLADACMTRVPETRGERVRQEEVDLKLPWNAARKTDDVRVIGTTGEPDVEHATRVSHAMGDFVRYTLRVDDRHREDFTIYMLGLEHRSTLLNAWPKLSAQTKSALMQADGGWLDAGNRLAEWSSNPARRIDGAARQTLGTLMIDAYGIDGAQGWAWEGIGLYLAHELIGTRLTWFFHPEGYKRQQPSGLWQRLQNPETDWFFEAERMLRGPDAPDLNYLLGRKINHMREQDVLHSYALAAYLLEGHPASVPSLLSRIGAGEHPRLVFEEELGFPLPTLEQRLLRWLDETRRE